jgi:murein DD-endopeptidase MepM/ murein hydrolase activator NlpD
MSNVVDGDVSRSPQSISDVKKFTDKGQPAAVKQRLNEDPKAKAAAQHDKISSAKAKADKTERLKKEKAALLEDRAELLKEDRKEKERRDKLPEKRKHEQNKDSSHEEFLQARAAEKESAAAEAQAAKDASAAAAKAKLADETQVKVRAKVEKLAAAKAKNDEAAAQKEAKAKALEGQAFEAAKVAVGVGWICTGTPTSHFIYDSTYDHIDYFAFGKLCSCIIIVASFAGTRPRGEAEAGRSFSSQGAQVRLFPGRANNV